MEGGPQWTHCKTLILNILKENIGFQSDPVAERVDRAPTFQDPHRRTPRPIIVAFLDWIDANKFVLMGPRMLPEKPVTHNVETVHIYVDQMFCPKVTVSRNQALLVRCHLKKKHPEWIVYIRFPGKLVVKRFEDDRPTGYKWQSRKAQINERVVSEGILSSDEENESDEC